MTDDTITAGVNHEFRIPLKSIGTAGYMWKIESLPDAIELLGSENERSTGDAKPGDSTTQVFRFRALKAGEYTVTFVLSRPWEEKAIESRSIVVNAG